MKKLTRHLLLFIMLLSPVVIYSQLDISQAKRELARMEDGDTARIGLLLKIAEGYGTTDPDSILKFSNHARELAIEAGDLSSEARAREIMGLAYYLLEKYTLSVSEWDQALEAFETLDRKKEMALLLYKNASVMYNVGIDSMAEAYWKRSAEVYEEIPDTLSMIVIYQNLGHLYHQIRSDYEPAIEYYSSALDLAEQLSNNEYIIITSRNLGAVYQLKGDPDTALYYLQKSEEAFTSEKTEEMVSTLLMLGQFHSESGNLDLAIQYQERALQIADEQRYPILEIAISLDLAESYTQKGKYNEARRLYEPANQERYNIYSLDEQYRANTGLAEIYNELNNPDSSIFYYKRSLELKDSIAEMRNKMISEQERILRELAQKEFDDDIAEQEESLRLQMEISELRERRIVIFRITFLILFSAVIIILFFLINTIKLNRQKRKANHELKEQFAVISTQQKEITDSLHYAKRIQSAVLPSEELISELLPHHFVFFEPRDIVSGDFYWIRQIGNYTVIVVADCTGHGVPGAFMSMLGISMLNELVNKSRFDSAGEILDRLRKKVKSTLSQEGKALEQKDGMDMALAILDNDTRELQFAGAFNPIYIVRSKKNGLNANFETEHTSDSENYRLYEIKGDRQPIAIYSNEKNFKTVTMQLLKDDRIYMFSDGYPDQIGGPKEKKFMIRKFKELLLRIQDHSMKDQNETLKQTLRDWKNDVEQVDDIIVFGVRLN